MISIWSLSIYISFSWNTQHLYFYILLWLAGFASIVLSCRNLCQGITDSNNAYQALAENEARTHAILC